ncbi:MAG: AMP-binding protein [Candidatus Omnitrophica bacterium]|nr:AMP-binding protein [Candidatus Omnitrophota bacterium]
MSVNSKDQVLTVVQRIEGHLRRQDSAPFLRLHYPDSEVQLTYAELIERASAWKEHFKKWDAVQGERIVIILKHSVDLYASFLGAMLGGYIPAMFAFPTSKYSKEEYFRTVDKLLINAAPSVLVTYPELAPVLRPYTEAVAGFKKVVTADDLMFERASFQKDETAPDAVAFLQYSSGTTGLKKGVAITHRALLWQVDEYARAIGLNDSDVIASWLPLYHDMGLMTSYLLPILTKTPLAAICPFDWVAAPSSFLQIISNVRATLCWLPNFAYAFLAKNCPEDQLQGLNLSSLRGVVNCSEPLRVPSQEAFRTRFEPYGFQASALCASYAMAENTFAVTSGGFKELQRQDAVDANRFLKDFKAVPVDANSTDSKVFLSSGQPLPETRIRIVSPAGQDLPDRCIGEIFLQTPCLLKEYFSNPEETARSLISGWYATGDLGYLASGELYVIGRKKEMLIIAGNNIYPQDVEELVNEVPGIHPGRVVAFGVENGTSGTEDLVVLAETHEQEGAKKEAIRKAVFNRIASATEVTARIVQLVEPMWLLKSTSGKISRSANRTRYLDLESKKKETRPMPALQTNQGSEVTMEKVKACVLKAMDDRVTELQPEEALISTGLVDSLGLAVLLAELETTFGFKIPSTFLKETARFDSLRSITESLSTLRSQGVDVSQGEKLIPHSEKDILMELDQRVFPRAASGFWTRYYQMIFKWKGICFGKGLRILGPIILRLDGDPRNIKIGNNVTIMPGVDLKIRENGKIVLHDQVVLDTNVRLVAAREGRIELGASTEVGMGTLLTGGADILIGRQTAIAGYCTLMASEHEIKAGIPIMSQKYQHQPILIGEGAWLAAYVFVGGGSRIGAGAVMGVKSTVMGDVSKEAIVLGTPARVIKYRN